jgi:hypothetical protein
MKKPMSFTVPVLKPRNVVATSMLDRAGPYKAKKIQNSSEYTRRVKHKKREEY